MSSSSILQALFSVFRVPSKTKDNSFCSLDGTALLGWFFMESKNPCVGSLGFFLFAWLCFGVGCILGLGFFCSFWLVLSPIPCSFSLGILVDHGD